MHDFRAVAFTGKCAEQVLVKELIKLLGAEHIARLTGRRIDQRVRQHTAHQAVRFRLMQIVGQVNMGHHHVVLDLVQLAQSFLTAQIARNEERLRHMVEILLVEGQPVLHLIAVAGDHLLAVTNKGVHHTTVGETVIAFRQ